MVDNTYSTTVNASVPAPVSGVYRYELIPSEIENSFYIDLWYQFALGDEKSLLQVFSDALYLNEGDRVTYKDGVVSVKTKEKHLKLVVNNG